jgi:hypothetical protein
LGVGDEDDNNQEDAMARTLSWMLASLLIIPVAAQAQVKPGQWENTVTVKSMDMPGAPPQMAEMMKRSMGGGARTYSHCVTPEQAAQGPRDLIKENKSCQVTNFSMTGGHFTTEMTCSQNGEETKLKSSGSYGPTSFNATTTMAMSGRQQMTMTNEVSGRWVGPCTGK